jgi:hypothetical protein
MRRITPGVVVRELGPAMALITIGISYIMKNPRRASDI